MSPDQDSGQCWPRHPGRRLGNTQQGIGVGQLLGRRDGGGQAAESRGEESLAGTYHRGQRSDQPYRRPGDEQGRGQDSLPGQPRAVGSNHHFPPADAVGQNAAAQHEQHLGHDAGREHVAKVGSPEACAQNSERERDRGHRRPEQRSSVAGVEPPEVLLAQNGQAGRVPRPELHRTAAEFAA